MDAPIAVASRDQGYHRSAIEHVHNGVHFPAVGDKFAAIGTIGTGRIGDADAMLFSTRDLVNFAKSYFRGALD
jgi:Aminoglycoside 3-N-acetyltransferase